ncbi:nonstructural protein 3 [Tylonycteris bat coronavirus HKU33]|uniref:Nonstructural protein 3 n=1 Tax=Tylonycteris bat coronavirus HKU33 TaxID=2586420 RepID=A0AAE6FA21_9ALPC|nr:nonstructural protein 3 [Tylonycteris bat coronavirus HKU33]QCX35161.1 nonstructural protein 3 [Tylonycteris bat coronavirus HKU33]
MLGLFQLRIQNVNTFEPTVPPHVEHITYFNLGINYIFLSLFVYYFAAFRCSSFRLNVLCFVCRLVVLFVYAPLLLYTGAYVDAATTALLVFSRLIYTSAYALRYRSFYYILLNDTTLMWLLGKCWYLCRVDAYVCLRGGDTYVRLGPHFIPFVDPESLLLSFRGKLNVTASLIRRVNLINGDLFYIFDTRPCIVDVKTFKP